MSTFFMMPLAQYLGGEDKLSGYRWAMAIMASAAVMFWICFANTRELKRRRPTTIISANYATYYATINGALSLCW
jgi:Na+/melibiose symporter-like transporter